jgi:ParB family chromosome partitioning protein
MIEKKISIKSIESASNRAYGGEGDLKTLAEDMKRNGLINPVTVHAKPAHENPAAMIPGDIRYIIIAGRRRVAAAKLLGWTEIEARVLSGDETERADEIAASENINRLAMHPLDEAALFQKIIERGEPIQELAKRCDRKVSGIWQRVQLLKLNEDIKALFRNGNLSLTAAAMLTSLDEKEQAAFHEKFKDSYEVKQGDEIEAWEVESFIDRLNHDRLYDFLADKECKGCKTRTFFSDKGLFPELDAMNDSCLNHECYIRKWSKLLAGRIKSLKGEHPDTTMIAVESGRYHSFAKIFGKSATVAGVEYTIKEMEWSTRADTAGKDTLPCFIVQMDSKLEIKPGFWKEPKKETINQKTSAFAPAVKILELPKEEARRAVEALEGNKGKIALYQFDSRIREKVFFRLIEYRAAQPDDGKEKELFIENLISGRRRSMSDAERKKVIRAFTGKEDSADLKSFVNERIYAVANALSFYEYDVPPPDEITKPSDFIKWTGIPKDELKAMYQEEIRALIPKPKAAGKKPGDDKPVKGKGKKLPVIKEKL